MSVLTVTMNDRAARVLGVRGGFGVLDPDEGLAPDLRALADDGIECPGQVACWAPAPADAGQAPGRLVDLIAWEQWHNDLHLEDFVSVHTEYPDGPLISVDAQRTLLRQGIALAREVGRLAGELSTPVPLRCIIATNETNGLFRFHRIRAGEEWLRDIIDDGEQHCAVVIDFVPRPVERFQTARVAAAQRAALFDLVELLAPDVEKARGRMEYVLENASWSAFDPENALIEALFDSVHGALVVLYRVISGPKSIRNRLTALTTCPEQLTWDWHESDVRFSKTESDLQAYLRLLAEHCRTAGSALVGVHAGKDRLALGFLPLGKVERFIELAAIAEAEIAVYGR